MDKLKTLTLRHRLKMRPSLRVYNPLAFYVTWGFIAFNVIIGLGIIFNPPFFEPPLFLSPNNSEFFAWGVALIVMGLFKVAFMMLRWA